MKRIEALFDRLDQWRNLPSYQLERRVDIFFALYLPAVLVWKLGRPIHPLLLPEFPIRIGIIDPDSDNNKSFKADYLAFSAAADVAILVELKTEMRSRRSEQDRYLAAAQSQPFNNLLEGLLTIFRTTNAKRKYYHLLDSLATAGLLEMPPGFRGLMGGESLRGVNKASESIYVKSLVKKTDFVYVQPHKKGDDTVSFDEFRGIVLQNDDPLSTRFAESLLTWSRIAAGYSKFYAIMILRERSSRRRVGAKPVDTETLIFDRAGRDQKKPMARWAC